MGVATGVDRRERDAVALAVGKEQVAEAVRRCDGDAIGGEVAGRNVGSLRSEKRRVAGDAAMGSRSEEPHGCERAILGRITHGAATRRASIVDPRGERAPNEVRSWIARVASRGSADERVLISLGIGDLIAVDIGHPDAFGSTHRKAVGCEVQLQSLAGSAVTGPPEHHRVLGPCTSERCREERRRGRHHVIGRKRGEVAVAGVVIRLNVAGAR